MLRLARLLSLAGGPIAVLGLCKLHARWVANPPYDFTGGPRLWWAIAYMGLLTLTTYAVGLPDQPRTAGRAIGLTLMSTFAAAMGVSAIQLLYGDALLPRFVVFGTVLVELPVQYAAYLMSIDARSLAEHRDRAMVVADLAERERLVDDLRAGCERPVALVGALCRSDAVPSQEDRQPVVTAALDAGATIVVLDRLAQTDERVIVQAALLHEHGVRIRTLEGFYEQWFGKLPVSELERASLFFDISEIHNTRFARTKRLMDLAIAVPALVAFALVIPIVLICNAAANRGPLLYRQERVGRSGSTFTIFKFRTMHPAGGLDAHWTLHDDPRVTRFGRWLRRTHIDELPQVLNIVRGDLSVVGPRPEQPHYVEQLDEKLPFYHLRHLVRPGVTGWAQVKYGYAGDEQDAIEKLQYEFFYLGHQNLRLDTRIIVRTLRSMLGGPGSGR